MKSVATPHKDPADRFLAATAKTFGLTFVTADENLIRSCGLFGTCQAVASATGRYFQNPPAHPHDL
jgi:hypothetical protein